MTTDILSYKDGIRTETQETDNNIGIGDSSRQGDFLQLFADPTFQPLQHIDQLTSSILMDKRMDFVDDDSVDPQEKTPQIRIGAAQHHIQ